MTVTTSLTEFNCSFSARRFWVSVVVHYDRVHGSVHQEYNVIKDFTGFKVIHNERNLPWSVYLGVAGMPGKRSLLFLDIRPALINY